MRGILILEGADATGKSTLAQTVIAAWGGLYMAPTGPTPNQRVSDWARLDEAVERSQDDLVVADRWWLSECVYGRVFRGGPAYDAADLDAALRFAGAVTVLCVRSDVHAHLAHFDDLRRRRPERFSEVSGVATIFRRLAAGDTEDFMGVTYLDRIGRAGDFGRRADVALYDMDLWRDRPSLFLGVIEQALEKTL